MLDNIEEDYKKIRENPLNSNFNNEREIKFSGNINYKKTGEEKFFAFFNESDFFY
jgi:hypothetical protein